MLFVVQFHYLMKFIEKIGKKFDEYYEIYVSCNMEELFRRDQKGLYSSAIKGKIQKCSWS